MRKLRRNLAFTPIDIFRKYMRYSLAERVFDSILVQDLLYIRQDLALEDEEVSDAIVESSNRIYRKLGPVMLKTEGLSAEGIKRKATVNLNFGKMLYLVETDGLLHAEASQATTASISNIFGATSEVQPRH